MGDHRMSIKIQAEFHGVKKDVDMYINYYLHDCCGMDERIIEFFHELQEEGMRVYAQLVLEAEKDHQERKELKELERLKKKYEVGKV